MEFIYIQYRFGFPGGREQIFKLRLDPRTFEAVESTPSSPPAWTVLTSHQCPNCPIDPLDRALCPAALGLSRVLDGFINLDAFSPVQVEVTTPERTFTAKLPLQKALSSLAGFVMATSGCPRTSFLRPMARFHLPFASDDETLYRATSMYLLAQHLRDKSGEAPDYELAGLADRYRELQSVNTAMTERLKEAYGHGAAAQAIGKLELFSHNLPFDIRAELERLRQLFDPYLE
jgi:hypothetical protein